MRSPKLGAHKSAEKWQKSTAAARLDAGTNQRGNRNGQALSSTELR
jgi:hypothetical protein